MSRVLVCGHARGGGVPPTTLCVWRQTFLVDGHTALEHDYETLLQYGYQLFCQHTWADGYSGATTRLCYGYQLFCQHTWADGYSSFSRDSAAPQFEAGKSQVSTAAGAKTMSIVVWGRISNGERTTVELDVVFIRPLAHWVVVRLRTEWIPTPFPAVLKVHHVGSAQRNMSIHRLVACISWLCILHQGDEVPPAQLPGKSVFARTATVAFTAPMAVVV